MGTLTYKGPHPSHELDGGENLVMLLGWKCYITQTVKEHIGPYDFWVVSSNQGPHLSYVSSWAYAFFFFFC